MCPLECVDMGISPTHFNALASPHTLTRYLACGVHYWGVALVVEVIRRGEANQFHVVRQLFLHNKLLRVETQQPSNDSDDYFMALLLDGK